jgi:8-oxo-dGTP pyrophosphatase MutT (NUDIX family)
MHEMSVIRREMHDLTAPETTVAAPDDASAGACRVQAAALPWRRTETGVAVMLITSRDTGRWVLPKGWPKAGELLCDAAAREAAEEAGIKGRVDGEEVGRFFYAKTRAKGDPVPCEVLVYPLEVGRVADRWKEKGQRDRKWVSPDDAAGMVAEPGLSALLAGFGTRG